MKIKRIEALNLNGALSDLIISKGEITITTRMSIIKTKLQLSTIAELFEKHRISSNKECGDDQTLFRNIIEEYLTEELDIKLYSISEEQFNKILDNNSIKTSYAELFFKFLVDQNGGSTSCFS